MTNESSNSLTPIAARVGDARRDAQSGALRIDLDAARRLLDRLGDLRTRARQLVAAGVELDRPLRFGDNWVGGLVSQRLRGVAVDDDRGVAPVLDTFHQVLDDVEATVRLAAGLYRTADDEVVDTLGRCAR